MESVFLKDNFEPTKKQNVFKLLSVFSDRIVRPVMNTVIAENRRIPMKEAQSVKVLLGSEVAKLVDEFR